jgi:hypothetical protein
MRRRWPIVFAAWTVLAMANAACADDDPVMSAPPALRGAHGAASSGGQPGVLPTPVPDVPSAKSGVYPYNSPPSTPSSSSTAPTPAGQFAPPPNRGPVTGYGPGGMGTPPGAPANPPYSFGGVGPSR